MAGFGRAVAEDAVVEQRRHQLCCGQRGRTDNKAVDQQQSFCFRRRQHGADHHGDLEAAEFGQHLRSGFVAAAGAAVTGQRLSSSACLRASPASSSPVPRPTQSASGRRSGNG
jgi:hypothetical protein